MFLLLRCGYIFNVSILKVIWGLYFFFFFNLNNEEVGWLIILKNLIEFKIVEVWGRFEVFVMLVCSCSDEGF